MEYYILGSIGKHTNEEKAKQLVTLLHPNAEILNFYPTKEWYNNNLKCDDILIFDELTDMCEDVDKESRIDIYTYLYNKCIIMYFDKCSQFNTETIRALCLGNTNNLQVVLNVLYESFISNSNFEKQKKSKSIRLAQSKGTHIGPKKGSTVIRKKSIEMKKQILELSIDFNGTMKDIDLLKELGIARNSFYKYKRELKHEYKQNR